MSFYKVFPRLPAACFVLGLLALSAHAQTETRPRQATQPTQATTTTKSAPAARPKLENDLMVVESSDAEADEEESAATFVQGFAVPTNMGRTERSMLSAIQERLGTPYRMGATGPYRFDCSGFVWSVFQEAGVEFTRIPARSLWNEFAPPAEGEKYKFGTLVFFNNLHHVGIVADENGFFHASSSHGVVYSRFDDYWTKRVSGFRRIPLAQGQALIASSGR
jgi:cell wall-associated NlpC family hydrolase